MSRAGDPMLEGLSTLDAERADSMAAEGGRSAQMVASGQRSSARPALSWWTLVVPIAALVLLAYRRLARAA